MISPFVDENIMELGKIAERLGWAKTGMLCGDPVGAAGVTIKSDFPGQAPRGEVWALFSPIVKCMPKSLYVAAMRGLAEVKKETGITQMWALCQPQDEAAARFLQHLGFSLAHHMYEWRRSDD